MTAIFRDFDEVWFEVSPEGMKLTDKEGVGYPFHFRIEIDASYRDDWKIVNVWIVDHEFITNTRSNEILVPLTGKFLSEAETFFYHSDKFGDLLQDKVDQECLPEIAA
jgi:hypothetical protein